MDFLAKFMDIFSKHWAPYPRHFPSPCPLDTMGDYQGKDHRVRLTFATCNFSIILRGRGDFHRKDRLWAVQAPCVITQWPGEALDYGPFVAQRNVGRAFPDLRRTMPALVSTARLRR